MADATVPGPRTPVWKELELHASRLSSVATRELVAGDAKRFEHFSSEAVALLMDYSRQRVDEPVMGKLSALADAVSLKDRIQAMWRGDAINVTEGRAVLHVALRQPRGAGIGGAQIEKLVLDERERMLSFVDKVRDGAIVGSTKQKFTR